MTIAMPDSIYPERLPPGYPAYLGYADGKWPTAAELRAKFPGAHVLSLTVTGATLDADGIDVETGNPDAKTGAAWVARKLLAEPHARPLVYADLATPGYSMTDVLAELGKLGISRQQVRVLTAHYTGEPHICGPRSCGGLDTGADGTQWTDSFAAGGSMIDMSELSGDFFGAPAPQPQQKAEVDVHLDILRQGSAGQQVRNWQALLVCHGYGYMIAPASPLGLSVEAAAGIDGVFGAKTRAATAKLQSGFKISGDPAGTVGAATWARALG